MLTVVGVVLSFVDVIQTSLAVEHGVEGNPLINLIPSEYQWPFVFISHIGMSIFVLMLGWVGRSPKNVVARAGLTFFVVFLTLGVVGNIVAMKLHGLL